MDTRYDGRPGQVGKSHSFGGYGPPSHGRLARGDSVSSNKSAGPAVYAKQDTGQSQQTWRISQPSSGLVLFFHASMVSAAITFSVSRTGTSFSPNRYDRNQ